jgi:hypothetical protein
LSLRRVPVRGDDFDLINEKQRRSQVFGLLEPTPDVGLGISRHVGNERAGQNLDERNLQASSENAGYGCLSTA